MTGAVPLETAEGVPEVARPLACRRTARHCTILADDTPRLSIVYTDTLTGTAQGPFQGCQDRAHYMMMTIGHPRLCRLLAMTGESRQ